jgi:hypothetical protein
MQDIRKIIASTPDILQALRGGDMQTVRHWIASDPELYTAFVQRFSDNLLNIAPENREQVLKDFGLP